MTRTPRRPPFPRGRPKPHQHGVLHFTQTLQSFVTDPLPDNARVRFASHLALMKANPPEQRTTVRLIISGEVETEVVYDPDA